MLLAASSPAPPAGSVPPSPHLPSLLPLPLQTAEHHLPFRYLFSSWRRLGWIFWDVVSKLHQTLPLRLVLQSLLRAAELEQHLPHPLTFCLEYCQPRHSQGGFTCCEEKRGCLHRGEMRCLWDLAGSLAVVSIRQARSTSGHEAAVEPGAWHEIGKDPEGSRKHQMGTERQGWGKLRAVLAMSMRGEPLLEQRERR